MAPHSSTLAWKIPWTEEPGGLQSMGLLGVSDTTEQLHFHFSLSCIGKGNGNPPQCSCLENPRDGGAWWAAVSGVAQSQTWLKPLSSSSSSSNIYSLKAVSFCLVLSVLWEIPGCSMDKVQWLDLDTFLLFLHVSLVTPPSYQWYTFKYLTSRPVIILLWPLHLTYLIYVISGFIKVPRSLLIVYHRSIVIVFILHLVAGTSFFMSFGNKDQ